MLPSTPTVVVTGFGPFGVHKTNPSWIVVKELVLLDHDTDDYNLVIEKIPVEYDEISKRVPILYEKYNPLLTIHVGVSGIAEALTLEQLAHNTGYTRKDVKGQYPDQCCCVANGPDSLESTINMQAIADSEVIKKSGVNAVVSCDAGRYCCDFIYYKSLYMKQNHAAFVHVPVLSDSLSGKSLAIGLKAAISAMLKLISNVEGF